MLEERLLHTLKKNGYSQKEIAKKMSISPSAINAWVKGTRKPDIDKLITIANILNVSTDYLLGLSDDIDSKASTESTPYADDEMLQQIINAYLQFSVANKHRLYADCLEYLEEQGHNNTDKKKKGNVTIRRSNASDQSPPMASVR